MSWYPSTHPPTRLHRFIDLALMLGGGLWIAIVVMIIIHGVQTGQLPTAPAARWTASGPAAP